jgi:hypothetical protein
MRFVILHQAGTSSAAGLVPPLSRGVTLHEHAPLKPDATGTRIRSTDAGPQPNPASALCAVAARGRDPSGERLEKFTCPVAIE